MELSPAALPVTSPSFLSCIYLLITARLVALWSMSPLFRSLAIPLADSALPPSPRPHSPPRHHQCHCVHMASACDMSLSQNTPDARYSPPLFQTLLNFKQNKRRGKGGRRKKEKKAREKSEHVGAGGMCNNITISFIHSFTLSVPPVHHQESTAL